MSRSQSGRFALARLIANAVKIAFSANLRIADTLPRRSRATLDAHQAQDVAKRVSVRWSAGKTKLGEPRPIGPHVPASGGAAGLGFGRREDEVALFGCNVTMTGFGLWSVAAPVAASTPMPISPPAKTFPAKPAAPAAGMSLVN
jgi:hypothetical protein